MLKGIVKPNGEIVSMDELAGLDQASAERCFEAGFICGVDEDDAMIIFQDGVIVPVTVQEATPKIKQGGNNGELQDDRALEQPAVDAAGQAPEQPADEAVKLDDKKTIKIHEAIDRLPESITSREQILYEVSQFDLDIQADIADVFQCSNDKIGGSLADYLGYPAASPNEPKPGSIKPFAKPETKDFRPSRKQARLDAESQNRP